jgi:hypothetical protein
MVSEFLVEYEEKKKRGLRRITHKGRTLKKIRFGFVRDFSWHLIYLKQSFGPPLQHYWEGEERSSWI